jgi:immunoglobulin-like protein involved in spore germination/sporulation and spore germination protein
MNARRRPLLPIAVLAVAALVAACGATSGPLGSVPPVPSSAEPSVAQGSPDVTPAPSEPAVSPGSEPTSEPSTPSSSPTAASPTPGATPTSTTIVRAYFWLGGSPNADGLVAVLREIPATKSVATAAMNALLAGPNTVERANAISSAIPRGSQLLGLTIEKGIATVDLSSEFASAAGSDAYQQRLGQVVYTLTQFPTVNGVSVQIDGQGDSNVLGRADYVGLLPSMWVDRPAWGAAIGNPAHVTGSADVFEATFRIAILDGAGKVLADQQVMATCGTGCRGTFDVTVSYDVSKAQYGTLRVYNPSAQDGSPQDVRDYRVWLTPAG